jgi:LytS/YehU family sensor histidine kinase
VEAADRMIAHLSDLLRYALESTGSQQVPLRQELGFLDRYLLIQQTRFGDRLELCREIDPETLDCPVPNLILQPLVENAIQHGIAPHARRGRIMMRARRQGGRLEIEIEDNGAGLKPGTPSREGVGLANTRARLQELYGSEQELVLANGNGGGLCVRLSVPWQNGTPAAPPPEA